MRDAGQLTEHRHSTLRKVVLAGAAVEAGMRGLAYVPFDDGESARGALSYVEAWWPLWAWAWVWFAVSAVIALSIVIPRIAIPSMSIFVGIHLLWGSSYIASWMFSDSPRSWVSGSSIMVIALFGAVLTMLIEKPTRTGLEGA